MLQRNGLLVDRLIVDNRFNKRLPEADVLMKLRLAEDSDTKLVFSCYIYLILG